jgi:hypothetical protein
VLLNIFILGVVLGQLGLALRLVIGFELNLGGLLGHYVVSCGLDLVRRRRLGGGIRL